MARITGIGGVFLRARTDAKALAQWYAKHLGLVFEDFGGAVLKWPEDSADDGGLTVWALADPDSSWFDPGNPAVMINYRVDDLDGIIAQLAEGGVTLHQGPETHENGRFAWILDPDGNKVELWEPTLWRDKG
jgi:predicted enzyme related to lactoylglutathione lyase